MSRIICVGHAALDRLYRIEAFPPTPTKVRAIEHIESGGGMAANAAAAIARLGGKVELWSRIGEDDAGVKIRTGLKAYGVDIRHVQMFEEGRSSTSAIIVDDQGERAILTGGLAELLHADALGTDLEDGAADSAGLPRAWLRPMDQTLARPIVGSEGLRRAYWSPDGKDFGTRLRYGVPRCCGGSRAMIP